jgi:iron complex outermembrane receptor protein
MKARYKDWLFGSAVLIGLMARGADAQAQVAAAAPIAAAGPSTVADVVVTARRQSEKAQDVPIALSVLTAGNLEKTGAYTLDDLQAQTPSLTNYESNPRNASVAIRGIGVSSAADGLDTSVGVYVDNVYLGRPGMALEDLVDIDQIEVLRGPQGTLFGRNSSAGVLNITTKKPKFDYGFDGEVSFGDYGYNQDRISITGPIIGDALAFRLTGFNTSRSGYVGNTTTGIAGNSIGRAGVRLQLLGQPNPDLSVRFIGEYSEENDTCCVSVLRSVAASNLTTATGNTLKTFASLGYTPTASTTSNGNNSPQNLLTDQYAFSTEINWNLGWADFTLITAERYWHFDPLQDSDNTPLDIIQVNVAKTQDWQTSQEFRLASKPGKLTWQAGVYLFNQNLRDFYILNQFGSQAGAFYTSYLRQTNPSAAAVSIATGSQYNENDRAITDSAAAFGQANYKVTDQLILTAGLRYTYDHKEGQAQTFNVGTPYAATAIPFSYNEAVDHGDVSYLGTVSYKINPNSLAYVSYSTGYKSAGLNLNSAVTAGTPLVLGPEHVQDWEIGLKQSLFSHRLTLNVDGYWTQLQGLQANIYPTNGAKSYLTNVGNVLARGVEADANWTVIDGLTLTANGSYNDAHYTSYPNGPCPAGGASICNLTGKPVYEAPRWIGNVIANYSWSVGDRFKPYVQGQYSYRSSAYGTVDDGPLTLIPAYGLLNGRIGTKFGDGRYDASVWVNNALNTTYYLNMGALSIPGAGTFGFGGRTGAPRTYGVTLRASL